MKQHAIRETDVLAFADYFRLNAELLAVDQMSDTDDENPFLYGAGSTGTNWQFSCLHRVDRKFLQNYRVFEVPEALEDVLRVLIGCVLNDE